MSETVTHTTTREPREHDFTRTGWGHSWEVWQVGPDEMRGLTHCTPAPHVGDRARWKTSYGEAVGDFTTVKWCMDPHDMWKVTLTIVERIERDG